MDLGAFQGIHSYSIPDLLGIRTQSRYSSDCVPWTRKDVHVLWLYSSVQEEKHLWGASKDLLDLCGSVLCGQGVSTIQKASVLIYHVVVYSVYGGITASMVYARLQNAG